MSEIPSTVKAPIESDAGVIVVVGTAPVNMADDPYHATNTPLLAHTMAEAKSAVGYSTDFKSYTICRCSIRSFSGCECGSDDHYQRAGPVQDGAYR